MLELIAGGSTRQRRDEVSHTMGIGDVMTRANPIVAAHISMGAARKIAALKSADVLIVEDKGSLMGILDSRSLATAEADWRVADCVKPMRICLSPATTLARARELFIDHGVSSFPVAAGPFLVGSVSRAAVERSLVSEAALDASVRLAA